MPSIIYQDAVGPSLLLPVVGSLEGAFGTFWRSEAVISNFRSAAQRIRIRFLPQGGGSVETAFRTLPPYESGGDLGLVEDDFLASLGFSGLGAALIDGVDADGSPDPGAEIDGFTRIYTTQPASEGCDAPRGTVSQSMIAIRPGTLVGDEAAGFAVGLRQDTDFRTNVGIVNMGDTAHRWSVIVYGTRSSTEFRVTVPANSMDQVPIPDGDYGNIVLLFQIEDEASKTTQHSTHPWAAYGSSVDNRTGDGWTRQAVP